MITWKHIFYKISLELKDEFVSCSSPEMLEKQPSIEDTFIVWMNNWILFPCQTADRLEAVTAMRRHPDIKASFDVYEFPLTAEIFSDCH